MLSTQNLPIGPSTDSYRLYLYVNIIDNDNGVTTYNISTPIQVQPDTSTITNLIQELSNPSSTGTISNILASGNSQVATTVLLSVSSLLNSASSSSNTSSNDVINIIFYLISVICFELKLYFNNKKDNVKQSEFGVERLFGHVYQ